MQEAGSATKNREDKYQFDNVERERERESGWWKSATRKEKRGKKTFPTRHAAHQPFSEKPREMRVAVKKTKRKKRTK